MAVENELRPLKLVLRQRETRAEPFAVKVTSRNRYHHHHHHHHSFYFRQHGPLHKICVRYALV